MVLMLDGSSLYDVHEWNEISKLGPLIREAAKKGSFLSSRTTKIKKNFFKLEKNPKKKDDH